AFDGVADFRFVGRLVLLEETDGRHDHPGGAVAALEAMTLPEPFLYGMELAVGRQTFDRGDGGSVRLDGEHGAGLDRLAVDQHRASPAVAGFAADVGAGEALILTQEVDQQSSWFHLGGDAASVDRHRDLHPTSSVRRHSRTYQDLAEFVVGSGTFPSEHPNRGLSTLLQRSAED